MKPTEPRRGDRVVGRPSGAPRYFVAPFSQGLRSLALAPPLATVGRPSGAPGPLIHERVRPQVAEQFLPLPLVVHQVQPLAVVLPLRLPLGEHEQLAELVPVPVPARPPELDQPVVPLVP